MIGYVELATGRHHRRMNLKVRAIVFHAHGLPAADEVGMSLPSASEKQVGVKIFL